MVALYSPVGTKYGGRGGRLTCTYCANTCAFRKIVAMQHPIVAIHELLVNLMVALYSPVGTKYGGWGERLTCTDCANTCAFRNIVAMQHPHRRHPRALRQLDGGFIFASRHQVWWMG